MNRQRQFLDLTGDFIASLDRDYRIEFMNRSGRRMLGIGMDHDFHARPMYVNDFHDDDNLHILQEEAFPQVLSTGCWNGTILFRSLDGSSIPVSLRVLAHLDEKGRVTGLTGVGQDLRLQQALRTQEAMADRILDSTIEGIMVTDSGARIQRVNPAFTQITGYTAEEVQGLTPRFLRSNHHEQDFYEQMNATLSEHGRWQGEVWNRRKSGEVYLQWMSISALRGQEGQVTHYVSVLHDLTEMRAKEAEIEQLAFTDPLTGVGNRHKLIQTLNHELGEEDTKPLALMCVDLGQLSPINDRFGMRGGDQLIRCLSQRLRELTGSALQLFRLTGDEFVILQLNSSDLTDIARQAVRCIQLLQQPVTLDGEIIRLSPSAGIALAPKDASDADTLLASAQTAMTAAKQSGRDSYRFYDEAISSAMWHRLMLEQQLMLATQPDADLGLKLYLQPKVSLPDGQIAGAEVLLRWEHPEKGLISPAEFIPLAEESRLIVALDRWVFARSCRLLQESTAAGYQLPRISINLSAKQLQEPDLVEWCANTVKRFGLDPGCIELEITETAFINLADTVLERLQALRNTGFSLALDDFGTGYSSLTYLRRLPLDVVKIDRDFVADLCQDERAATLLQGVMQLLDKLDFSVVAEGIETTEQSALLHSIGCNVGQGFLFHRPMPADEFIALYYHEASSSC